MKEQADKKAYVHQSSIKIGDNILCHQPLHTKHATSFKNQPYMVTKVKRKLVSAARPGHTTTRHITFFKKLANAQPPAKESTQALPDYDAVGIQHQHHQHLPNLTRDPPPFQQPPTSNQTGIPPVEIRQ